MVTTGITNIEMETMHAIINQARQQERIACALERIAAALESNNK